MRHQPKHVAGIVDHTGDLANAPVRVLARRVAEGDLPVRLQAIELVVRGEVAAAHVLDRDREALARGDLRTEWPSEVLGDDADLPADEAKPLVGEQRAGKEPRLAE